MSHGMFNLLGVGQYSPHQIYDMLSKHHDVKLLQFDARMEKPTSKRVVLLCPTLALFNANREILNQCPKASVIVFDTPVKLEYLKPIELLDVASRKTTFIYKFKEIDPRMLRRIVDKPAKVNIDERIIKIIPRLLRQSHDSFTAMILNFLSRIPNSEYKEQMKLMVYSHLSENKTTELADLLEEKYKRSELVKVFIKQLRDGKADSFAAALNEMASGLKGRRKLKAEDAEAKLKATNYKKLSKVHGVSKFDLTYASRYLSKILTAESSAQPT